MDCEEQAFGLTPRTRIARATGVGSPLAQQVGQEEVHVLAEAGRVIGYISFAPNWDHLYVHAVAVHPAHQRRGHGRRLLSAAERAGLDLGLGSVRLFADGMIAANIRFYRRQGYVETGRCDDRDFSRIFYSKPLGIRTAQGVSGAAAL